MPQETFGFQAEVSKLLNIVANALYSHKEIFLRELISNASDACDKLRYRSLTEPELLAPGGFKIAVTADKKAKTLSVTDNGIGMDHADLMEMLGTIARSGTQRFLDALDEGASKDLSQIGQFGVGFYASFMVADRVEVLTRKAGDGQAWLWASDGRGEFTIEEAEREVVGTTVTLHLNKDAKEFLERDRLERIIKTYSDHIGFPIALAGAGGDGEAETTVNQGSALWTRPKAEISEDQYREFYHHAAHAFDDPWMTVHNSVEGVLSYTNLLFVPSMPPFDLFDPERKAHVKLYVNRVFITDDCEGLMPPYLRFVKGVVDSPDLSLNISREMLQHDPKLRKISKGLVKRLLGEFAKKAEKEAESYAGFWKSFGAVLKEGIYESTENRDKLLALVRAPSTSSDGLRALDQYVADMKDGQEAIYYLTGDDAGVLARSPQLEGYRAKGVEVLLFTDPVDEFWLPAVGSYADKPFRSVAQGAADLAKVEGSADAAKETAEADAPPTTGIDMLIAAFKEALGEGVKDVRATDRLTESAVCLVADEGDVGLHLERLLKQHNRLEGVTTPRILEVNPKHALIRKLAERAEGPGALDALSDAAHLLLDQARIIEGEPLTDAQAFAKRLDAVLTRSL